MKKLLYILWIFCLPLYCLGQDIPKEHFPKIFGVSFGSSYNIVENVLSSKFGDKSIYSTKTTIQYNNVMYGGSTWEFVYIQFQYNGSLSYMNRIVFTGNETKDVASVKKSRDNIVSVLEGKYNKFKSGIVQNGFKFYYGGPIILKKVIEDDQDESETFEAIDYLIRVDVVKLENGNYCSRINYGPIPFVDEEF